MTPGRFWYTECARGKILIIIILFIYNIILLYIILKGARFSSLHTQFLIYTSKFCCVIGLLQRIRKT